MDTQTVRRCFAIGLTCGLRSMTGPAVTRWRLGDPLRLAVAGLAAGEILADKFPGIPPRTSPPPLTFRILSGAFCGRSVALSRAGAGLPGALYGAAGALAASYAATALRSAIVKWTGIADPLVAVAEDALAIGGALRATDP